MKRKLLALTLALAMAFSVLTTAALAETPQSQIITDMHLDTPVAVTYQDREIPGAAENELCYFRFVPQETGYYTISDIGKFDDEHHNDDYLITVTNNTVPSLGGGCVVHGYTSFMLRGTEYIITAAASKDKGYQLCMSSDMGAQAFFGNAPEWNVGEEPEKTVTLPATTFEGSYQYTSQYQPVEVHVPETGRYIVEVANTQMQPILLNENGSFFAIGQSIGTPNQYVWDLEGGKTYYIIPDRLKTTEETIQLRAEQVDPAEICLDGNTHDYTEQSVKKASLNRDGEISLLCDKCGRTETVTIPAIEGFRLYDDDQVNPRYISDGTPKEPLVFARNRVGRELAYSGLGHLACPLKVTYSNNVDPGTATATIVMDSAYYEGQATVDFQIESGSQEETCTDGKPHDWKETVKKATFKEDGGIFMSCSKCGRTMDGMVPLPAVKYVKLSATSYTYNGKAKKPKVSVGCNAGELLASDQYKVTYSKNTNAGTATATVTLTGKWYEGSKKLTFTIKKAANPMTVKGKTATVKYSAVKKKTQTVAAKKAFSLSKAQGKVTYKKSGGNKNITVSSAGKLTVKKKTKKGSYPIKVKVTAAGNGNYKAASKTVTVTVKVK